MKKLTPVEEHRLELLLLFVGLGILIWLLMDRYTIVRRDKGGDTITNPVQISGSPLINTMFNIPGLNFLPFSDGIPQLIPPSLSKWGQTTNALCGCTGSARIMPNTYKFDFESYTQ